MTLNCNFARPAVGGADRTLRSALGVLAGALAAVGCSGASDTLSSSVRVDGLVSPTARIQGSEATVQGGGDLYILHNRGLGSAIEWEVDSGADWLQFAPAAGRLASGQKAEVRVVLDPQHLDTTSANVHEADFVFRNVNAETVLGSFTYRLVIDPNDRPELVALELSEVELEAASFDVEALDMIETSIRNDGVEDIDWRVSVTEPWLVVPSTWKGSIAPGNQTTIEVAYDATQLAGLPAGTHTARVIVEGTRASGNSPALEPVTRDILVTVQPSMGNAATTLRNEIGAIAVYDFESPSTRVTDASLMTPSLDLAIEDPNNVTWYPGRLRIDRPTRIQSVSAATKLVRACQTSNEISVEAWVTPANIVQDGPARIATVSDGAFERTVTLSQGLWGGQAPSLFNTRLRTTATDINGMPHVTTPANVAEARLQHVVYTRNSTGTARMYVDGVQVSSGTVDGTFEQWDPSYRIALANEIGDERPWLGDLHLVAFYARALSSVEVERLSVLGSGDSQLGVLEVSPSGPLTTHSVPGGMPNQSDFDFELRNPGTEEISWRAEASQFWSRVTPESGTLAPGAVTICKLQLIPSASTLGIGTHETVIGFQNITNGLGDTTRVVRVVVEDPTGPPPPPPPPPYNGAKPGPHNTGPTNPGILQNVGSMTITQDGAVIENVFVNGRVEIQANNVTIRNFIIDGGDTATYGIRALSGNTGILIEDGEIRRCSSSALFGREFTARRLNIHEMQRDGMKLEGNNLIEGCWIHHLGLAAGAHADGNQTRIGSNITMRGNNFDMPVNIPGGYRSNAASINQATLGDINNLHMDGNWLNGGNFTVYFLADNTYGFALRNCSLTNNRFGRDNRYGVLSRGGNLQNLQISGNVWDDTGELMDIND